MLNVKFSTIVALLRQNWNPDLPLEDQTWLNLSHDEAQPNLQQRTQSTVFAELARWKFGKRTSALKIVMWKIQLGGWKTMIRRALNFLGSKHA